MTTPTADRYVAGSMHAGDSASRFSHAGFILSEALLVCAAVLLSFLVIQQPGPLPGDVNIELGVQHALLPRHLATAVLEWVSTINWPVPAGAALAVIVGGLLLWRRWLDAVVVFCFAGLADASNFLTSLLVQRPRPDGYGIAVLQKVSATTSFPSGHVVHAIAFLGILIFLSFQTRRLSWLLWPLRALFVVVILLMFPSRLLEGEHWPTDVLAGAFLGAFWLVLGMHAFAWAARRWPRLLAGDERERTATADGVGAHGATRAA